MINGSGPTGHWLTPFIHRPVSLFSILRLHAVARCRSSTDNATGYRPGGYVHAATRSTEAGSGQSRTLLNTRRAAGRPVRHRGTASSCYHLSINRKSTPDSRDNSSDELQTSEHALCRGLRIGLLAFGNTIRQFERHSARGVRRNTKLTPTLHDGRQGEPTFDIKI